MRYRSPVGPLRIDIAYNTGGSERLPVVSVLNRDGQATVVSLGTEDDQSVPFNFDPFDKTGFGGFLQRLQFHFSIGQAF